jgi:hypothetical protein
MWNGVMSGPGVTSSIAVLIYAGPLHSDSVTYRPGFHEFTTGTYREAECAEVICN